MSLFKTGVRPVIDDWLLTKSKELRDYGDYWSASGAGYCQRKLIFERLGVPYVEKDDDARRQRLFTAGHLFHDWIQQLTKDAGVSIAQEIELQDEDLMVRGHFDDLVLVLAKLILYDYKTVNSKSFTYVKQNGGVMSHYHRLQLGTYLYMIRQLQKEAVKPTWLDSLPELNEARILKISKDDLRMDEQQLLWSPELEFDVLDYWNGLNEHWNNKTLPACSCAAHEGGFMAKEKWNPYFYQGEPCSLNWYKKWKNGVKDVN